MGIPLSSQFDPSFQKPLDSREVVADLTARDAIPAVKRYEGMKVWVSAEGREYRLVGGIENTNWALPVNSYHYEFTAIEWMISGDLYQIEIAHNLNTLFPITEIKEGTKTVYCHEVEVIDKNNIRITIPTDPDLRFSGSLAITAT